MFPGRTPFGYYNAPVSKALFATTGTASALNLVLFQTLRIHHSIKVLSEIQSSQYFKIFYGVTRLLYFSDVKSLIFGSLLLYSFRIFEHRYGSKKFTNFLFASTVIGRVVEYFALWILQNRYNTIYIPSGPFRIIFSLFIPYYFSLPSVGSSNILGFIPISGKLFTYAVGLQLFIASKGSLVAGLSGLIAGVLYHSNVGYVLSWLKIPDFICNICWRAFGGLLQSSAPTHEDTVYGATLEIQRQQRMDELDQQMWRMQEMSLRRTLNNQTVRRNVVTAGDGNEATGPGNVQQPTIEVSEVQVQRLMEMGFSRQAVLQALAVSNNDMTVAMNILISE